MAAPRAVGERRLALNHQWPDRDVYDRNDSPARGGQWQSGSDLPTGVRLAERGERLRVELGLELGPRVAMVLGWAGASGGVWVAAAKGWGLAEPLNWVLFVCGWLAVSALAAPRLGWKTTVTLTPATVSAAHVPWRRWRNDTVPVAPIKAVESDAQGAEHRRHGAPPQFNFEVRLVRVATPDRVCILRTRNEGHALFRRETVRDYLERHGRPV